MWITVWRCDVNLRLLLVLLVPLLLALDWAALDDITTELHTARYLLPLS